MSTSHRNESACTCCSRVSSTHFSAASRVGSRRAEAPSKPARASRLATYMHMCMHMRMHMHMHMYMHMHMHMHMHMYMCMCMWYSLLQYMKG